MRSGEMTVPESAFDSSTHLCFGDVSVDDIAAPGIIKLRLRQTHFAKGWKLYLAGHTLFFALSSRTCTWPFEVTGFSFYSQMVAPLTKARFILKVRLSYSNNTVL